MSNVNWTPQQSAFFQEVWTGVSSIVLEAVAGSGKTTVLMEALRKAKGQVAVIAFNKSIAEELKKRIANMGMDWKKAEAGTVHSFGFRAYKKLQGNTAIGVDGGKVYNLVEAYFTDREDLDKEMKGMIRRLVSLAKNNGVGIQFPISDDLTWLELIDLYDINDSDSISDNAIVPIAQEILIESNKIRDVVDFDDMIYFPLLFKAKFWQYDIVMIDEAQDINWSRRTMAARMLKSTGRLIAVGDRAQAIYGFTGADSASLDNIRREFNAIEMPLSVCFRCGSDIISRAQTWNKVIQAKDGAIQGEVSSMTMVDFKNLTDLNSDSVMLCRNTKPLVEVAFDLIRRGIAVYVEGRDIGEGLKKLASRWKVKNIDSLINKLDVYRAREIAKAKAKNNEAKIQMIEDQVDTLMVIISRVLLLKKNRVSDVIDEIDMIFRDTDGQRAKCFTLSTIHKSKGREFHNVYWLDRAGTLPSKYAKKDWQIQQEFNLCYVAATRAMNRLIEVIK